MGDNVVVLTSYSDAFNRLDISTLPSTVNINSKSTENQEVESQATNHPR